MPRFSHPWACVCRVSDSGLEGVVVSNRVDETGCCLQSCGGTRISGTSSNRFLGKWARGYYVSLLCSLVFLCFRKPDRLYVLGLGLEGVEKQTQEKTCKYEGK